MFRKLVNKSFIGFLTGFTVILATSFFFLIVVSVYAFNSVDLGAALSKIFDFFR